MLTNPALRLLRNLLGTRSRSDARHAGNPTVLDGNCAVAVTEAVVSEAAGLGGSFPADGAALAWRAEQRRHGGNLAGMPLATVAAESPGGALAAAMGQALAGVRATTFLSGPDLAGLGALLHNAAGRHLPLVAHVALRALPAQGATTGSGHEALHAVADSNCLQLIAVNVQEAVDFALIARRAAEQALLPALVAMDGTQTALAMADVHMPPAALVEAYLGQPDDRIPCPTQAQAMVFGEQRRRVPRWHDPDRPVLLGGRQAPEVWARARAAAQVFFDAHLVQALEQAFKEFETLTGRAHRALSSHALDDASLVLVAQGAVLETVQAVADRLRETGRIKVGVLGVRALRPFPGAEAARLLGKATRVCVLERMDAPLAGDPPLLRELRAALDRALENGRYGDDCHPGYPCLKERQRPRFLSVIHGLGGLPLRGTDLQALCLEAQSIRRPRIYLGLNFAPDDSPYPKRQVLLDRLRRSYPDIADLGLQGSGPEPDLRPRDSLTLAIHRPPGAAAAALATDAASLLQRQLGGGLRSRPGLASDWGSIGIDLLSVGPGQVLDPGDTPTLDLVLLLSDSALPGMQAHRGLGKNGVLLVRSVLPDDSLWAHLPPLTRDALRALSARLYRLPPGEDSGQDTDYLLGALCGVLLDCGQLDAGARRLQGLHEEQVRGTGDARKRTAAFQAGLEAPRHIDVDTMPRVTTERQPTTEDEAPALLRRLGRLDDAYDSLPRFWDQVGVLYRNGDTAELAPDPYLALNAVPPLSGGLQDLSMLRRSVPLFDPESCTGCGACWSSCPDGAVGASILSPAHLIQAGIAHDGLDVLRPLAAKLAAAMAELCRDPRAAPLDAGQLLSGAFDRLAPRLPFPDERKAAMAEAVHTLSDGLGGLPLAATEDLFVRPENAARGSGELLALAIDPTACKGCGICARVCEPDALQIRPQDSHNLAQTRRAHRAWQHLPENTTDSLQRLQALSGLSAATLLAPGVGNQLRGVDGAEPGSGGKLVLRQALAAAQTQRAPHTAAWLNAVKDTGERIKALIRELLVDALPADDLEALARGLAQAGSEADLGTLTGTAENAIDSALDAARLRRLVDLARRLGDLEWRLAEGHQGMGRAAAGLVLAPGAASDWAAVFPHSPFCIPVAVDSGADTAQLTAGLAEAWLRHSTADLMLMRKADLELEHPEQAARRSRELNRLTWRDLDPEERALCPPLLLLGDAGLLAGPGLAQLHWLLGGDLPVKLLLLADLDLGLSAPPHRDTPLGAPLPDTMTDLGLLALSQRNAFVAQSSPGAPEHLQQTLLRALEFQGPALLHVHAPSPARHGFPTDRTLERAAAAVQTRTFPLFRYDPEREGVFGSRFDLEGNTEPCADWQAETHTPAHWALGEQRFAGLFSPFAEDAPNPLPLIEYLALDPAARRRKTPYVDQAVNGGESQRLRLNPRLLDVAEERRQAWRMLQELAGLVTPFTARVREEAEQAVAEERKAELAAQAAHHEAQIRDLREQIQTENREQIRDRLMGLAGYKASLSKQPAPPGEDA
jgi:pyruvate-ferredoxin/flavodoxin oxidoreductase